MKIPRVLAALVLVSFSKGSLAAEPPVALPEPVPGVLSTGQPTPAQLEEAARSGVRTVINLRADAEPGFEWEEAKARELSLRYVRLPISGPEDLTRANVERLDAELRAGLEKGRVLLHCASGNRNGALLALREAWLGGATPEAALKLGRAAGLTRLEPTTRKLLGLPPEEPANPR